MSDPVVFDPESLAKLDDQQWRRLGVTQTFDRLLVDAAATHPGTSAEVRDHAGRNLSGGAARFWELSFPQMKRDLVRKRILAESAGELTLNADFADRIQRLLHDIETQASHVEPTPGVTLEELNARAAERERQIKAARRSTTRRASTSTSRSRSGASESAPKKRSAPKPDPTAIALSAPTPKPTPTVAPPKKLFTTRTVNTLLDRLDNTALNKVQLGGRIGLRGADLERFLEVTGQLDITRFKRDDLVELHWEGRKLAKTSGGDRRMAIIGLVEKLRGAAEAPGDSPAEA